MNKEIFIEEALSLIRQGEGLFIEFKSLWERGGGRPKARNRKAVRDTIAKNLAAFANADGGTLFLGVEDNGDLTGHSYPPEAIESFFAVAEERLVPPTPITTQRLEIEEFEILLLHVASQPQAVMVKGGGFPYRVGDQVVMEPQKVIDDLKQAHRRVGYDQRIRSEATLDDLDLDLARTYFSRTAFSSRPTEDILQLYGLIIPRSGGPAITEAALLLFAKPPISSWHPHADIRLFRVHGRSRRHGPQRNVVRLERIEAPIAKLIGEAHRFAATQIQRSEKLHDLFFREMPEYPEFAWQEAIVNAVAHRDYSRKTQGIEIWFYEDRMEVISPGELVPPVTLAALRERRPVHASRNPLIVRPLVDAGIMREEGEGIPRMFEEMEQSFLHLPKLTEEGGCFRVTLRNEPAFTGITPEWQHLIRDLPITPDQRRVLAAHPRAFLNPDYQRLNRVDRDQAYRSIQEMVSAGVVQPASGSGRTACYEVSKELVAKRLWLESRVPVLRRFLRSDKELKNADFRDLFSLERSSAKRELNELVDRGFLRREGERRGTHYVAGPELGGEDR